MKISEFYNFLTKKRVSGNYFFFQIFRNFLNSSYPICKVFNFQVNYSLVHTNDSRSYFFLDSHDGSCINNDRRTYDTGRCQ